MNGARRAQAAHGYLRYAEVRPVVRGLNHQRRNLECLLREAHALGRCALLPPLRLSPAHNLGVDAAWRWETYFDLDASRLVDAGGRARPLPLVRRLPGGCAGVDVLTRRIGAEVFEREVPVLPRGTRVELRPSARVRALAAPVAAALAARAPGGFAAVHVRRGDRLFGPMRWLTEPAAVRRALRRLGVADGATVFCLSDEREPAYWRPLAAVYDLVRAADFPAAAALVAARPPDNYLLYEVEKAVMRRAAVRLETFPGPDYEPADAVLVPPAAWWAARRARRSAHAALRLARRALGERAWTALRSLRGRAPVPPGAGA